MGINAKREVKHLVLKWFVCIFLIEIFFNRLHDDCKGLQNEISDLKKQIVRRRKRLRSLRPKLKQVVKVSITYLFSHLSINQSLVQSTDPVRRYIESQFDDTNNLSQSMNNPSIAKLPDPLYVLYSLVLAYQQCDGMLEKSGLFIK